MTAGKRCGEQPLQAGAGGSKGQDSKKEKKEKKNLYLMDYLGRLAELRTHLDVVGESGKNS